LVLGLTYWQTALGNFKGIYRRKRTYTMLNSVQAVKVVKRTAKSPKMKC